MISGLDVNTVVLVVWLDSGLELSNYEEDAAREAPLCQVSTYGRVVDVNDDRVLLEHETGRGLDDNGHYTAVALSCVLSVQRFEPVVSP